MNGSDDAAHSQDAAKHEDEDARRGGLDLVAELVWRFVVHGFDTACDFPSS